MNQRSTKGCPVCASSDVDVFLEIFQIPAHCNTLWPSRDEALQAPRGDLRLGFCPECGHMFNLAFDPSLMSSAREAENPLQVSPLFRSYAESLAAHLIERHDLRGKKIIEIGCRNGRFLRLLCKGGRNRGVGFEPRFVPDCRGVAGVERVTVMEDFYHKRSADHQADLVCCRHVLEHIDHPRYFLNSIRRAIGEQSNTPVYSEVPSALHILKELGIWDLNYEHCSYFSGRSLTRLFTSCGFTIDNLRETYGGQVLSVEALPNQIETSPKTCWKDTCGPSAQDMAEDVKAFSRRYRSKVQSWQDNLEKMKGARQHAIMWEAGCNGVTFLNALGGPDPITHVVDVSPQKQGMYVPGTGQRVVPPAFLEGDAPDVVIVMNPAYEEEIRRILSDLGISPELRRA